MSIDFKDKVAIVTGAGGGLGRSHALELAKRGAKVVVNDLGGSVDGSGGGSAAAQKVVEEIKAGGGAAIANGSSVSDKKGVENLVKQTLEAFGRIDILINNAGILRDKSFKKMELEDFQLVVDVHLMGSVYCTKAVWPVMDEQKYGRIVMTTSPSGLFGNFGQANYGAAKLGLVGFMNTLKIEGAKNNIRVNAIAPVAATRMTENLIPQQMLDRLGPEKVTPGVLYLCSDDAPSGVVLQAAGGRFNVAAIVENQGVDLKDGCTVEAVAENWEKISDLSGAKQRAR
jgi:NAD(P)-dependent dehydrogenase (short-subunit alcohol dehydrogenase family)